jgi:hypothetical protein
MKKVAFASLLATVATTVATTLALTLALAGCGDEGFGSLDSLDPEPATAADPAAADDLAVESREIAYLAPTPVKNVATGKCIDAPTGTALVPPVNQFACNGAASEIFALHALGTFGFGIHNVATGKCIDLEGTPSTGYKLRQATCNLSSGTSNTQRFFWGAASGAARELVSGYSTGLCVDVPGALAADGLRLRLAPCSGIAAQKWLTL